MTCPLSRAAAALALLGGGALLGGWLAGAPAAVFAKEGDGRLANMEVIVHSKSNEPLVFVFDPESRRLLMYTTVQGTGGVPELRIVAARNTAYDARIEEYRNKNENGMSVKELKEAFESEERKEKEAARKKAEEDAKRAKKENG